MQNPIEADCDKLEDIKAKIMRLARKAARIGSKYELEGESQEWVAMMDFMVNGDDASNVHGAGQVRRIREVSQIVTSLDDIQEGVVDYLMDSDDDEALDSTDRGVYA